MAPNVNVMPFGSCSVKNGSACMPVPTSWQGFEDGIFIGNFNPLLEDSILPCGLGGKIEIFYSLEEAEAACDDGGMSFWEIVGAAVLVVAAVALIVVTGGAVLAAVAAVGAASGALATTVAVGVLALEATGLYFEVKALYDYTQDGDEEALFKGVALGFLFLGAGKVLEKGFRMLRNTDEVFDAATATTKQKGNFGEIASADNLLNNDELVEAGYDLTRIGDDVPTGLDDTIKKGIDGLYENATPPPDFVIDEAKYGTSTLGKTKDGKQMGDRWITGNDRLVDQVGPEKAREIMDALDVGDVDKVLSKIDEFGNVTTHSLDSAGNIVGTWP